MSCIDDKAALQRVLSSISFGPSGLMLDKMDLQWEAEDAIARDRKCWGSTTGEPFPGIEKVTVQPLGWHVRLSFLRPDTITGVPGRGTGRWELIEQGASESSVVKTCWLLLELLVRHELMESFRYKRVALFSPHRTVEELAGERLLDPAAEENGHR